MHEKPEYQKLVSMLYALHKKLFMNKNIIESEPFLGNMWANINPPGGSESELIIHPNSLWSGVYWIKTPKNCGHLKIDDPRSAAAMSKT